MRMSCPSAHIIILAAGRGQRLRRSGETTSKWLLSIEGRTLAERHLEAIHQASAACPGRVASSRVVAGHALQSITRFLERHYSGSIDIIDNAQYAELNNWYSLLLGLRSIPDKGKHDTVIVFNCDLLAKPSAMAAFIEASLTTESDALVAVDLQRHLTEESMKVTIDNKRSKNEQFLTHIGKTGIVAPDGEYVGMLMARGRALRHLQSVLESFLKAPTAFDAWYEQAVGQSVSEGAAWRVWAMPDSHWVEIDDDDDYGIALELAAERGL
jgi:choline kinase